MKEILQIFVLFSAGISMLCVAGTCVFLVLKLRKNGAGNDVYKY